MVNTLRIKRRSAGGAVGAPVTLASSEIAYNEADNILYYGYGDNGSGVATSVKALAGLGIMLTLTGAQTIGGVKTFSDSPIVPTPITNFQSATKKYVDDNIASGSIADGDKGDIIVSGSGTAWTIDSALLSAFMRTVTLTANASDARDTLGVKIGTNVQAYTAVLQATTASFLTAHKTKLDYINVTQTIDLDDIKSRINALDAVVVLKGTWSAAAGTFPGGGTAKAGDSYIVSAGGTVGGVVFDIGDRIIAVVNNASTTVFASNWFKADYTDQVLSVAGRTGAVTITTADITNMSANGRSLVTAANYAAMRTALGLGTMAIQDTTSVAITGGTIDGVSFDGGTF